MTIMFVSMRRVVYSMHHTLNWRVSFLTDLLEILCFVCSSQSKKLLEWKANVIVQNLAVFPSSFQTKYLTFVFQVPENFSHLSLKIQHPACSIENNLENCLS